MQILGNLRSMESEKYASLNPYLVSGQGIWKITDGQKREMIDETILSVTEKLTN